MSFADQAALAVDEPFRDRVRVALATAAVAVMGEDPAPYDSDHYGRRQALAYQVLSSAAGGMWLEAFTWGVVANPAVTAASNDGDIQFTVNSLWDDMSGVRGAA